MTVDNPIQYEVELVEKLWSKGWAAFRTSSQAPGGVANCDIIAMSEGKVVAMNVVILDSGTSTKKVGSENDDLVKIKRRADSVEIGEESSVVVGHAVKKVHEDSWSYGPIDNHKIRATRKYDNLNSVFYK